MGHPFRSGLVTSILLCCLMAACGCRRERSSSDGAATQPATENRQQLNIAAAADLQFALDELAARFRQSHRDADIRITYGSSGNLFAQLSNKAPFDLFFSADLGYPRKLAEQGLAESGSEFVYGVGRIVLWVPKGSGLDISTRGLEALTDPAVKKMAIANPQHAPYGRAAEAALKKHDLWQKLIGKLVLGENIAQAAQYAQSGTADAGIIAQSLALAPRMQSQGRYWLVPQEDYPKIEQAGVILSYTAHRQAAEEFRQFVIGPDGRAILARHGFVEPGE